GAAQEAGIPVVGGNAVQLGYDISPDFFASGTNIFAAVYGDMVLAKTQGSKIAILPCTESAVCAQSVALYKAFTDGLGMEVVYSQAIAASTPDFTAVCQALKDSGAQSYVIVDAVSIVARVSNACVQQGVKAILIESSGAVGPELLTAPGAEGLLAADVDFPFTESSSPATKHYHDVMAQYLTPEELAYPGTNTAWTAFELFGAAVKLIGTGDVTPDSIKNALYSMKDETLGGLAPPLNFVKDQTNLQNCYFVLGIKGGAFVAPNGITPSCAPEEIITPLAKAFLAAAGGG
ncbi:MAG: hypothetical protein JWN47_938, partial [Frankiales bacterium]|nr:hypothetical protein [Frankiales bacterium]